MALVAVEIPKIGLVMESARLVRWLKSLGEQVRQGEPLLEVETEKSIVEIESTASGRLIEILLEVDQEARVGDRIAWLENDDAAPASLARAAGATSLAAGAERAARAPATQASAPASPSAGEERKAGRLLSSPAARRLAARSGIELGRLAGTGPRGRVQLRDVQQALAARSAQYGPASGARGSSSPAGPLPLQPLSSMRRAVARSMTLSNATVPQFVVERAVEWTALRAVRARLIATLPTGAVRPSVNDFVLQALARSLLAFPALNATFSGDPESSAAGLVPAQGAHIGLVVAVEDGLLVPVLHGIEQLGLTELARRRSAAVARALEGRLRREELEGATLSLSNLGARGPDRFTALVVPPQAAILAVGRQRDCVLARNGGIEVRPMSQLALTVDHRVADGRLAAEFLATLVGILEGDAWRLD